MRTIRTILEQFPQLLPSILESFCKFSDVCLDARPTEISPVAIASYIHEKSFPQAILIDSLMKIESKNSGLNETFLNVSTLSPGPYVKSDCSAVICPEKLTKRKTICEFCMYN